MQRLNAFSLNLRWLLKTSSDVTTNAKLRELTVVFNVIKTQVVLANLFWGTFRSQICAIKLFRLGQLNYIDIYLAFLAGCLSNLKKW